LTEFARWLSQTSISLIIQTHEWVIPTIQSIHIVAIGIVLASALMIELRILGWAGRDQTFAETRSRFGRSLAWALAVLLISGALMVIGEPARELLAFSFWFKMALIVVGTIFTALTERWRTKPFALLTLVIWAGVVILGRLIAYDHIWGAWSHSPKA
jgi:hypothetical protein